MYLLFLMQVLQSVAVKELEAYGLAGSVAEEVLSAIRIVAAYAGEEKEVGRWDQDNVDFVRHIQMHCKFASKMMIII